MVTDAERKLYSALIKVPSAMVNSSMQPLTIDNDDFINRAEYIMCKRTGNDRFKYKSIGDIPQDILEEVVDRLKDYVELDIKIVDKVTDKRAKELALKKYPDSFMTKEDFIKQYPVEAKQYWSVLKDI